MSEHDPYRTPEHAAPPPPQGEGDATGGVIPYKNPAALIAYYLGLFSLIPCLGLLLAIPALILGIVGLRARAKNPAIKGSVHAWIGIVLGGLMTLLWGGLVLTSFVGSMAR
ncbi:MAG: hypothetical protein R3F62_00190 [Planctomycetota bacterium]